MPTTSAITGADNAKRSHLLRNGFAVIVHMLLLDVVARLEKGLLVVDVVDVLVEFEILTTGLKDLIRFIPTHWTSERDRRSCIHRPIKSLRMLSPARSVTIVQRLHVNRLDCVVVVASQNVDFVCSMRIFVFRSFYVG